jgi:hypothetical protein
VSEIASILGTTKKIVARDSKIFAQEIAKYIDSKDQKRGKKKDKEAKKKDKDEKDAGALWPLIRQVNVRCPAAALSTGAVLVDLPGVADANAARNNIAKNYMKKCDCIWILAPITRAVDDKTARGTTPQVINDDLFTICLLSDLLGDAFRTQLMSELSFYSHETISTNTHHFKWVRSCFLNVWMRFDLHLVWQYRQTESKSFPRKLSRRVLSFQ